MENKYDNINLDLLVRSIQLESIVLDNLKEKKKTSTRTFAKRVNELRLMRESAIARIELRDRNHPSFFPIGCIVIYQKQFGVHHIIKATVEEYEGDSIVVIRPEKSEYVIKVNPKDIIIYRLRNN